MHLLLKMIPRPTDLRTLTIIVCTLVICFLVTSCGNGPARSSTTEHTGAGGLMIGQSREAVEKNNPKWTVHKVSVDNGSSTVVYRDYHWSLARGYAHSAEYHHVTYSPQGEVVGWISNSNPDQTKE